LDHLIEVSAEELPFEYMMNRLRLHESFNLNEYEQRTGLSVETVLPNLMIAKQKDLMIENTDGTWQVSKLGHRYLNDLLEMFL
ncbi:MAG: YggW family oxidoreductase, partial [Colwellia sp.]